jgi:Cft2 family RNA processing exonuclease
MEAQERNTMRIRFLGAVGTVTGSCTLLEYNCCEDKQKQYFLVDAGSFVNETSDQDSERKKILKNIAKDIKIIFITHAHLDHIGILPDIIKFGFKGKIYCTQATHKLIITMLTHGKDNENNIKLFKKDSFFDIDGQHGDKQNTGFGKTYIPMANNLRCGILRSSHVLGSCSFYFQWTDKNYPENFPNEEKEWKFIYFSGDIGPVSDKILANILFKGHQTPYWGKYEQCIIMECTYGGKIRQKENLVQKKFSKLSEIINTAISNEETVIIPAFALDRAQQILIDLYCIFKNKNKNDNDNTWKTILIKKNFQYKYLKKPSKIGKHIESLNGNEINLLNKITNEIAKIGNENKIEQDSYFADISEKCQTEIAEIFEKNAVQKPIKEYVYNTSDFSFDSPLIEKINEIYIQHLTDEAYSDKDKQRKFKYISDKFIEEFNINIESILEGRNEINKILSCFLKETGQQNKKQENKAQNNTKVIVTASGMCDEGRVVNLLEKYLTDEKAVIVLTGFQASGTNGYLFQNLSKYSKEEKDKIPVKLLKGDIRLTDIKCRIEDMSDYYSGHADQEQLLDYVSPDERNTGNITVLLNHGTDSAREKLKLKKKKKNHELKVILPEFNKWLNVSKYEYEPEDIKLGTDINEFVFSKIGDIHIYYPKKYDEEKIELIINYINELQ